MVSHRNRLLSFILEHFMLPLDAQEEEEKINEKMFTDEKLAELLNFNLLEYKFSGSTAEKLYLPFRTNVKSDIDMMLEFPHMYVVDPEQLTVEEREQYKIKAKYGLLNIDYSNEKYPCYISLYFYKQRQITITNEKTDSSISLPGTNEYILIGEFVHPSKEYLPSSGFMYWFENLWPIDKVHNERIEVHGPSLCTTSNNSNLPLPMDHVPTLKCIHWPKPAMNWINRTRLSNWPNGNLIQSLVKYGCHVVALSHVLTSPNEKQNEWRLSFSMCEIVLAKTLNFYQKKCYLIIKALVDVHIKQDLQLSKSICSYYLKTILFWLCESFDKEQWTYESLYDRFIDFIDYMIMCYKNKCLKHYFIPEMNLLDHLNDEDLRKISEKCLLIKNDLVNMIKICEEYYHKTNQFERFKPIIEVLIKDENLHDNSCLILCCANTMRALIEQHQLIDLPLKIVNDCIKRHYLELCSDEVAQYLLYVTSRITYLFDDDNEYSIQSLSTYNAMIKICQAKSFYDQLYDDMNVIYNKIENHLNLKNN